MGKEKGPKVIMGVKIVTETNCNNCDDYDDSDDDNYNDYDDT